MNIDVPTAATISGIIGVLAARGFDFLIRRFKSGNNSQVLYRKQLSKEEENFRSDLLAELGRKGDEIKSLTERNEKLREEIRILSKN